MKRLTSVFLVLVLILSLLPAGVLAQEGETVEETSEEVSEETTAETTEEATEPVEEASEEATEESSEEVSEPTTEESAEESAEESSEESSGESVELPLDGDDADAAGNSCGAEGANVTWMFEDGKLTITGTGAMADYVHASDVPWYLLRDSIIRVEIGDGVTSIGRFAFDNCRKLTSITIPNTVTSIGESAFYHCIALPSLNIPASVTSIGKYAIYNAFFSGALTSITVDEANPSYCDVDGVLFSKDKTVLLKYPDSKADASYKIPDGVKSIGGYAFRLCRNLTSVTISDSVEKIEEGAFSECSSLTDVTNGSGVKSIGEYSFFECVALTNIEIPSSVTSVGARAFSCCGSLTSVTISNNVISIGRETFSFCNSLTDILVAEGNKDYCSIDGVLFDKNATTLIQYPGGSTAIYTIPSGVTSIGEYAFEGCRKLEGVIIPSSVTSIGDSAFVTCESLTSITIPDSVTSIGEGAFDYCRQLASVTIGKGVKSIGEYAFYRCDSLENVYYTGTESDWNDITIGEENDELNGAERHYEFTPTPEVKIIASGDYGDDLRWTLDEDGVLTISGTGTMKSYPMDAPYEGGVPWYEYRDSIKAAVIEDGVPNIGDFAFYRCTALKSVEIPDSVTLIENSSFEDCTALESITLPDSVKEIGNYALFNCTSLARIEIGHSVTIIGADAFNRCSALADVYYAGTAAEWSKITVCDFNAPLNSAEKHFLFKENQTATKLDEIEKMEDATPEVKREAVKEIGSDALKDALQKLDKAVKALEELEKSLSEEKVPVVVAEDDEGKKLVSNVSIIGAGLNEKSGEDSVVSLTVKSGAKQAELPDKLDKDKAVYLDMSLEGVKDSKALDVPVCVSFDVPQNIQWQLVQLVHYNEDGTVKETLEPGVKAAEGKKSATFVLDGFSSFALTELAHEPGDVNGNGETDIADVMTLLKKVAGVTGVNVVYSDVDNDGDVDITDVMQLLKSVAGVTGVTIY